MKIFSKCFNFAKKLLTNDAMLAAKDSLIFLISIFFISIFIVSCISTPSQEETISRMICGVPIKSEDSLYNFFVAKNPNADKAQVRRLAKLYIEEAAMEGINSDVAFVQMCHETDYLRFGNLVSADMHNYCGLGAIDAEHRGEVFKTEQLGVRAHIQHLHAYGTMEKHKLKNKLIDNRYRYVQPRGKAPTIFELTGTWAADKQYGAKLDRLLTELEKY